MAVPQATCTMFMNRSVEHLRKYQSRIKAFPLSHKSSYGNYTCTRQPEYSSRLPDNETKLCFVFVSYGRAQNNGCITQLRNDVYGLIKRFGKYCRRFN